jgi:cytochrome c-type biogenesis protein CcmH
MGKLYVLKPSRLFLALTILIGLLAVVLVVSAVSAEPAAGLRQGGGPGNATPNDVSRVARQLYCPVCPNTPLDVCETQACQDWRELIRQKLSAGASDREIVDYFVQQYGQRVLAQPEARGFNLLVWIIPAVALLAGAGALVAVLRAWSARRRATLMPVSPPTQNELPADYVARIERELSARSR